MKKQLSFRFSPRLYLILPSFIFLLVGIGTVLHGSVPLGILLLLLFPVSFVSTQREVIDYSKKTHEITFYFLFIPFKKIKSLEGFDTVTLTFDFEEWGQDDHGGTSGYWTSAGASGVWSSEVNSFEIHLYTGKTNKYFLTEYGNYATAKKLAEGISEKLGFNFIDAVAITMNNRINKRKN